MKKVLLGALLLTLTVTGCSQANTQPDTMVLHYEAGPFSSIKFKECVEPSKKQWDGPGDKHYEYPVRQVTYDATGGKDAESGPITVVSKDNAELSIPVTVSFNPPTDCDVLRKFHENYGRKYEAYFDNGKYKEGWIKLLVFMIGQPLDTTLDRAAQNYNWRDLWNNPTTKVAIEKSLGEQLQTLVAQQSGGETFFTNFRAVVQKPDPTNQALKDAIASEQASVASAQSAEAQARARKAQAEAELAVSQAEAAKKKAEIAGYGTIQNYLWAKAIEAGLNPWQPIIVPGGVPTK